MRDGVHDAFGPVDVLVDDGGMDLGARSDSGNA